MTGQPSQRIELAEWLKLRRPPPPEFVRTLDRLPPGLAALVGRALPPGRPVEGALLMPAEYYARPKSVWEWAPERALVFLGDAVLMAYAEASDKRPQVAMLDAGDLLYARSSLVLLYGLLELKTATGEPGDEVRVEYNSVIWETFRACLTRFVSAASRPQAPSGDGARAANAEILKSLPYKFANGLQYNGLTPGERLLAAVYQPEIREGHWFLSRQRTPNTVLALTDQKIVIIEETVSLALHAQPKGEHGWAFTYIPRDRVAGMVVTAGAQRAELRLRLAWGSAKDERTLVLDPQVAAQWERAWRAA